MESLVSFGGSSSLRFNLAVCNLTTREVGEVIGASYENVVRHL